jgi:uncharacterized protein (TIRG00374 family)
LTGADVLDFSRIKKRILISIILGLMVFIALGMYSDYSKIAGAVSAFNYAYLPFILLLAPMNYVLRYIKWSYYLKLLNINIDRGDNIRIFAAGLGMTVTPGKVGEFLKSYLIKEFKGIPISVTSPLIIIERLTDGISMIILASIGALRFKFGAGVMLGSILLVVFFISFVRIKPFALSVIRLLKRLPVLKRLGTHMDMFYSSSYQLLELKPLLFSAAVGIISWGFEGIVIYLALTGFGSPISILSSVFIVAFSSIAGALSMLPGGLFVAEGSIMAILVLLGVPAWIASAATIVTRFSTLWLGVFFGIIGLLAVQNALGKRKGSTGNGL